MLSTEEVMICKRAKFLAKLQIAEVNFWSNQFLNTMNKTEYAVHSYDAPKSWFF